MFLIRKDFRSSQIKPNFILCVLTLKDPFISESCIEIKIELNFYFHTSFKAFIKPFEAPQRSVKIKISLNFFTLSGIRMLRVK